jgi:hypothetical protein
MSHGAQVLYVALKRRYSVHMHNNGRLFLSQRMAEKELNSHHNQIARWYRELQHYGFIVLQVPGCLGVDGKGQGTALATDRTGLYEGTADARFHTLGWRTVQ